MEMRQDGTNGGHLFDSSNASLVARVFLVVLILGVLIFFWSQHQIDQASSYSWAASYIDGYEEKLAQCYLMAAVGVVMRISGGVGVRQYLVRKR